MKILLDENILPDAKNILQNYGHDVITVVDNLCPGLYDETIFKFAQKEKRALITQNGKHFIILIPPLKPSVNFFGLIWIQNQVTKKNYVAIMQIIGEYFKNTSYTKNTYYRVKKQNNQNYQYTIDKRYPKQ